MRNSLKLFSFGRLTDTIVALKEIRLEHEEGAPCTAIREGLLNKLFILAYISADHVFKDSVA